MNIFFFTQMVILQICEKKKIWKFGFEGLLWSVQKKARAEKIVAGSLRKYRHNMWFLIMAPNWKRFILSKMMEMNANGA